MADCYECITCKYTTKDKSNLKRHNNTKKHLNKINDINIATLTCSQTTPKGLPKDSIKNIYDAELNQCAYCYRVFTRNNNLGRHLKSCSKKKLSETQYTNQIKLLNAEVSHYKNENENYKEDAKYYKSMLMEAGGLVKKSVSALTYSIQNYGNAPHIKTIQMDEVVSFEVPNKKIIEDVLSAYKHKTLNKYLGEIILKLYKTSDPEDQSIWNTDDSRLTYLIKELLNNKASNWIVDKKGIKTVEYLIDPLLEHIKKLTIHYQKNYTMPEIGQNSVEVEMILENSKKIIELVNAIDDGVLAKDILRYISSHLRFNDNSSK